MAAAAAGGSKLGAGLFTRRVASVGDFETALAGAVKAVEGQKGAFLEAVLERRE
jgi:hypothetical protein